MAPFAFVNATTYVGQFDLTTYSNNISGKHTVAQLDVTTFGGGGWHARIAGLHDIDANVAGFADFSTVIANVTGLDQNLYPLFATINVVTISETDGTFGAPAEMFRGLMVTQPKDFAVGEAAPFSFDLKGASQWGAGQIVAPRASRTVTYTSSAVQLGTSALGQLVATRHIFAVSGNSPTLATFISSATNSQMLGSISRAAFTTATAVGGEFITSNAIAVTSGTWWNVTCTFGGTGTPTFDHAVALSIR